MIRNRIALLAGTLALVIVPSIAAAGASAATVEVRNTAKGEVLTDSKGFTLFMFSVDVKRTEKCQSITNCPSFWPPLIVEGAPTAGTGVNPKKLGTIMLANGTQQVTYKRHPLYGFVGDSNPEETFYAGAFAFGGYWFALNPKGGKVGQPKPPA
jgi:predicted lipoprotein with Yx(FWY)xxD motif